MSDKTSYELSWPTINATQTTLKTILEENGFKTEHQGRSGIANRNSYKVTTADGIISEEALASITQIIQQGEQSIEQQKTNAFDQYFDEQSADPGKTFALINTGGEYSKIMTIDRSKYTALGSTVSAYTADHRYSRGHTYLELVVNDERMKNDPRKSITIEVPQDLMGKIIGKGGSSIKAWGQKYNKHFKIVQDPREISKNKANELSDTFRKLLSSAGIEGVATGFDMGLSNIKELNDDDRAKLQASFKNSISTYEEGLARQVEQKHQKELVQLGLDLGSSFGEGLIDTSTPNISEGIAAYLKENYEDLPVIPSAEELVILQKQVIEQRDQKRQTRTLQYNNQIATMSEGINTHIENIETQKGEITNQTDLKAYIEEAYPDSPFTEGFIEGETAYLAERQQAAAAKIKSLKNFDKVAEQEFERFYNNDAGCHGSDYFNSVGKDRRANAYQTITDRTLKRLGLYTQIFGDKTQTYELPDKERNEYYGYHQRIEEFQQNQTPAVEYLVEQTSEYSDYNFENNNQEIEPIESSIPTQTKEDLKAAKKAAKSAASTEKTINGLDGLAAMFNVKKGKKL